VKRVRVRQGIPDVPGDAHERAEARAVIRARVVHHIPGRTRLRAEALPEDAAERAELQRALAGLPGVYEASLREATGSVVLRHRRDFSLQAALAEAQASVPLEIEASAAEGSGEPPTREAGSAGGETPAAAGGAAGRTAGGNGPDTGAAEAWGALWARLRRELPEDLRRPRDLAATLVLALAAVQIARGQVLGSATSLLWYAYQLRSGAPRDAPDDTPEDL
jgi:hypothetical protein